MGSPGSGPLSPNRLLSRMFQRSFLDDYERAHEAADDSRRTGHVSRSNSSVGSIRSMGILPSRTPSPLDFRTVSFRRPRSLADDINRGKREARSSSRTDSGFDRYWTTSGVVEGARKGFYNCAVGCRGKLLVPWSAISYHFTPSTTWSFTRSACHIPVLHHDSFVAFRVESVHQPCKYTLSSARPPSHE